MNSGLEHHECAEALGAYALGALSDAEAARVREHLSECRECRAELDWLGAGVDVLPASVPPIEPPPELKRRLMAIVEAEAELMRAAGETVDHPQPMASPRRRRWLPASRFRAAAAFAALCVAVVAVVLAITAGGGTAVRTIRVQITKPAWVGRVRASLEVRGTRAQLMVSELPAPAADHVDELWIKRGSGPPTPAGIFVVQSGSIVVASPVRRGDLVLMTIEPGRGTSAPTTRPLLVARV